MTVDSAREFVPPAWSCGFGGGERDVDAAASTVDHSVGEDYHRSRDRDDGGDIRDHNHHQHDGDGDDDESESSSVGTLFDLHRSLRGSTTRLGKPRRVLNGAYSYWVDVYVEIDYSLCNDNGETCADGIGPNTINYGAFRCSLRVCGFNECSSLPMQFILPPSIHAYVLTHPLRSNSVNSVNALFVGANTIYEVSVLLVCKN